MSTYSTKLNAIKNDVQRFKDISINECFEQIDTNDPNGMTIVSAPIYYFFDTYVNDDIGSNPNVFDYIRHKFELDELFGIERVNLIDLFLDNHSTKLYFFEHDNVFFILF